MILTSRLQKILNIFLKNDDFIMVQTISEMLDISTRTVFRELEEIDYLLKPFSLKLISKNKLGLKLIGSPDDKERFSKEINKHELTYLSKTERQNFLTCELLRIKELEKISYYAMMFSVSEATISNDLDDIEIQLKKNNLKLIRKAGQYITLSGKETDYRKALSLIINKNLALSELTKFSYNSENILKQIFNTDSIMNLLNKEITIKILDIFDRYSNLLELNKYAQSSYVGLVIHLSVAIDRILKNEEIKTDDFATSLMKNKKSYEQAKKMVEILQDEFNIKFPIGEIAFIAMHIQGAKLNNKNIVTLYENDDADFKLIRTIKTMINAFETEIPIKDDQDLFYGLMAHLKPTITRIKYNLPIFNPLLKELKKSYYEIFIKTKKICEIINSNYNIQVEENEIGFITMHFGAAIERNRHKLIDSKKVKIAVICSSGIGVSALLSANIKQILDVHVDVESYSLNDLLKNDINYDLLLSTFDISNVVKDYLKVNAILKDEDIVLIKQAVKNIRYYPKKSYLSQNNNLEIVTKVSNEAMYLLNNSNVNELSSKTKTLMEVQEEEKAEKAKKENN